MKKPEVLATVRDKITTDAIWCGTFNIVWEELKKYVGENVRLAEGASKELQNFLDNLNDSGFDASMVSPESIVVKVGDPNNAKDVESVSKQVKNKFDEVCDIIKHFDTDKKLSAGKLAEVRKSFFANCMLCKKLEFVKKLDILDNLYFKSNFYRKNVPAFGIDKDTKDDKDKRSQIEVLYFNDESSFAVAISTKTDDQIMLVKNPVGENFAQIYDNTKKEAIKYRERKPAEEELKKPDYNSLSFEELYARPEIMRGKPEYIHSTSFLDNDKLLVPKLNLDVEKEFTQLYNKTFIVQGDIAEITKAVQKTKFELDEVGARVKSEALVRMEAYACAMPTPRYIPRNFRYDDNFTIFLKEKGKKQPYFAGYVTDIDKWQSPII